MARLRAAGAIVFGKTNTPEFAYGPLNAYHYGPVPEPVGPDALHRRLEHGRGGGAGRGPGSGRARERHGRVDPRSRALVGGHGAHADVRARPAPRRGRAGDDPRPRRPDDPLGARRRPAPPGAGRPRPARPDVGGRAGSRLRRTRPRGRCARLRVGVPRGYLWDAARARRSARRSRRALDELRRLGLAIEDVEIPGVGGGGRGEPRPHPLGGRDRVPAGPGGAAPGPASPRCGSASRPACATSAVEYIEARRASDRFAHALRRLFARVDLLALPGRGQTAPRMDESGRLLEPLSPRNYTAPLNYPGVPALTVPCGFDAEGLPIGIQLVGSHWARGHAPRGGARLPAGDRLAPAPPAALRVTRSRRCRPAAPCTRAAGAGPIAADRIAELAESVALPPRRTSSSPAGRSSCFAGTRPSCSSSSADERARLMDEVSDVARALKLAFDARKVNYALFGNLVPHMHWHLIPRLATDPAPLRARVRRLARAGPARGDRARRPDRPDPRRLGR